VSERIQPICPIRSDAKCMGAMCAWSSKHVREDGVYVFTCCMGDLGKGQAAVIDRNQASRVERF